MSLFSLKNIAYSYGNTAVLSGVNLEIQNGELTIITGANGIGKTTLLQLLAGVIKPTAWNIERNISWKIAYVAQEWPERQNTLPISVAEFVGSHTHKHKHSDGTCDYRTLDDCLGHVGLLGQKNTPIDELSGWQKQRAMIARALMMDPDVLLLDEPTAGIDVHMQEQFYDLIKHFNTVHGLTTIMITHDAERQYTFGDHIICLAKPLNKEQEDTLRNQFKQKTISLIQLP